MRFVFFEGCPKFLKFRFEIFLNGQEVKNKASFGTDQINQLRYNLIKEELEELRIAIEEKDLLEVADALTDILYVTYGAGHAFGIDLDKCFNEVQESNMSKSGEDGKPIYNENGKVIYKHPEEWEEGYSKDFLDIYWKKGKKFWTLERKIQIQLIIQIMLISYQKK